MMCGGRSGPELMAGIASGGMSGVWPDSVRMPDKPDRQEPEAIGVELEQTPSRRVQLHERRLLGGGEDVALAQRLGALGFHAGPRARHRGRGS